MARRKKQESIPEEYLKLDDEEITRLKKLGDMIQSVEKGKIQRVKADEAARNVIDTKAVVTLVTEVFSKLKSHLYSATNKIPAQIAGKEHAEITHIMFQFVEDVLTRCNEDFVNKLSNIKISDTEEEEND